MQMIIDTSTIEQTHGFALSLKSLPFGRASRVEGYMSSRRCAHSDCVALWYLHFQYGGESSRIQQILTEHSVKVRPFFFPFTIGKCNMIYSECVKVFFVRICSVFNGSQGQTRSLFSCM